MKYFMFQLSDKDCGISCAKICMAKYYDDTKYLFINEYHEEASFMTLHNILSKYNIESKGIKVSFDLIDKSLYYSIAYIYENGLNHFVLLKKITKNYVYLIDSSKGLRIVSKNYFKGIFTNYLLKIEYQKINNRKSVSFDIYLFTFIISLIIDFLLIYISSYILKGNSIVLLISLMFVISINIIFKILIIFAKDKSLSKKLLNKEKIEKLSISQLKLLSQYKSEKIHYQFTYLSYIVLTILISLFLLSNSIINIFNVFYSFLFAILKNNILSISLNIENEKIILEESTFHLNHYKSYLKMHKLAYKYLFKIILFYAIFIVFLLILTVFINYIFFSGSLSNFIFMITISTTLYGLIDKIFILKNKEIHQVNLHKNRIEKMLYKKKLFFDK